MARLRSAAPLYRRSGENATNSVSSSVSPDASARRGAYRLAGVADRQRGLEDDRRAGVDAGEDRLDGRIHDPVIRPRLVVEHDRDDEHDDVRRRAAASAPSSVARRRPAAWASATSSARPGFLADVRPTVVDALDDGRVDVHRDDRPAVARELGGQRQAHLAGADDGHRPGRARARRSTASTGRAGSWRHGFGRQDDRPAEQARCGQGRRASAHAGTSSTSVARPRPGASRRR